MRASSASTKLSKLSLLPPAEVAALARRLADTGIAVTVLTATDLYLMGRERDHGVVRGVARWTAALGREIAGLEHRLADELDRTDRDPRPAGIEHELAATREV